VQLAAGNNNPYNSPIQRANPNSRQGSVPATPGARPVHRPNPRPPTLDNRGIGNGDNLRRQQQTAEPGTHPASARFATRALSPFEGTRMTPRTWLTTLAAASLFPPAGTRRRAATVSQ
jgi:hypothetical protein